MDEPGFGEDQVAAHQKASTGGAGSGEADFSDASAIRSSVWILGDRVTRDPTTLPDAVDRRLDHDDGLQQVMGSALEQLLLIDLVNASAAARFHASSAGSRGASRTASRSASAGAAAVLVGAALVRGGWPPADVGVGAGAPQALSSSQGHQRDRANGTIARAGKRDRATAR